MMPSAVKFHACPAEISKELTINRHDAPSRMLPSVWGGRRERSFISQRERLRLYVCKSDAPLNV